MREALPLRGSSGERLLVLAAVLLLISGSAYDLDRFSTQSTLSTPGTTTTGLAPSRTSTVASSPAVSQALCLVSVPGDAELADFRNSTFNGNNVTYANGTSVLFSAYACPRPVYGPSGRAPDVYSMALAAVENSSFVGAENGSRFIYFDASGLSCGFGNVAPCNMTLFFYKYVGDGAPGPCRDAQAGIEVTFHTQDPAYNAEVNGNTGWDLGDPDIGAMTQAQVQASYGLDCT